MSAILDALSDATRRQIVYRLSLQPRLCTSFGDLGSKTKLSYHYTQLRKAGLTSAEKQGVNLLMSLRLKEVEAAFPGLLEAVLKGAAEEEMRTTSSNQRIHGRDEVFRQALLESGDVSGPQH